MEPDNPARGDQPARWVAAAILTAVMLVLTGVGLWLLILHIGEHRAGLTALIAFEHNPNADLRPGDAEDFHRAITDDWYVIAGYLLTLSACSVAYKLLAFSDRGKKLAPLLCGTLAVVGLADVVENLLVLHAIHHHAVDHRGPHLAIQVAATIKWSAFLVAALSFPLALACSVRLLKSYGAKWWTGRPASGTPWWHRVLAEVEETPGDPDGNQRAWRDAYRVPDVDPTKHSTALCLSGGGVRSACVAMGAMQIFSDSVATEPDTGEKAAKLDTFDYVISVSGGGYSAGARLLAVQSHPPNAQSSTRLSERFSPGSPEFDHLRRRSSYLADSVSRLLRALGEVVKNLLASLFILFSLAVLIGSSAGGFYATVPLASFIPDRSPATGSLPSLQEHPAGAWVSIALLLGIAAIVAALALLAEWWSVRESFTVLQSRLSRLAKAVVCFALITFGLTVALPGVMYLSSAVPVNPGEEGSTAGAIGGIATVTFVQLVATVISIVRGKDTGAQANEPKWWTKLLPRAVLQLAITLGTLLLLAITWLLVMGITGTQVFHFLTRPGNSLASVPGGLWYLTGILLLVMGYLWCCDVTSLSLHPFYRTRLARAFSVRRIDSKAVPYDKDEPTWLDEYGRCNPGPEFVFAAAAAVSDDTQPGPGQHAISFVMGADYIGSPALGWLKTSELRQIVPARIKRDLTVQAAVATSGAAFASTMGRQSTGLQTLFAASGARLGTWLPNPNFVLNARDSETKIAFPKALPSVRGAGYFYRELLQSIIPMPASCKSPMAGTMRIWVLSRLCDAGAVSSIASTAAATLPRCCRVCRMRSAWPRMNLASTSSSTRFRV